MKIQTFFNRFYYQFLMYTKKIYQFFFPDKKNNKPVLFVAGVQRSGTNMIMDVLERSFNTDVYHERDPRAFDTYEMRELSVIKKLYQECRAKHFVIKSLCELQDLNRLMEAFPNAKIVWVIRHYDDVINSMLVSFRNQAKQTLAVANDKNGSEWRGRGMTDQTHALVRRLAYEGMSDASGAALFWYYRNILFFDQKFDNNSSVLPVSYEALVQNPEYQFKRIFDFSGIKYTPWISKIVHARSIGRREAKEIDKEIQLICEELYDKFQGLSPDMKERDH